MQPGGRELWQYDLGRPWRVAWFVEQDEYDTAALASIGNIADCVARADAQVRAVLGEVMAQSRSTAVASGYVGALSPGTRANCWSLAESVGHEGVGPDAGAARFVPADAGDDLIGPGIAIDETAQLKHGGAACVAPQHAWCIGQVVRTA